MPVTSKWTGTRPKKYALEINNKHAENTRVTAIKVLRYLLVKSPVDSGLFKGNWQVSLNAPAVGVISRKSSAPRGALDMSIIAGGGNTLPKGQKFNLIYIANNLPYARRLEDGHSTQAPNGMIAGAVARYK